MSKRGRKKKLKINFNISRETMLSMFSLLLLLLAFLSLVSFIAPNYSINSKFQYVLRNGFGYAAILVPFILGLFGLLFIEQITLKIKEGRIVLGLAISLLALSSLFHLFTNADKAYSLALKGQGGGLVGYYISDLLKNTISLYGAIPLLLITLTVGVLLIFDITLSKFLSMFQIKMPTFKLPFNLAFGGKNKFSDIENVDVVNDILDKNFDRMDRENNVKEVPVQTTIEIIPTMAEPQEVKQVFNGKAESIISSVVHKLGVDKIWMLPPTDLLVEPINEVIDNVNTKAGASAIKDKLRTFGIGSELVGIKVGPSVTQYELKTTNDVRMAKVANMHTDLAAALASTNGVVRIEAPIPGTSNVGIEVPNIKRSTVNFKSLITSGPMKALKSKIGIVLGKDVGGQVYTCDIGNMPHLLVAGATGSGKSIFIHNILFSILFKSSPQEVKLILVDPKRVELTLYQGIPHLLTPVVTDMEKAPSVFKWAVVEMENRYKKFEEARVQNIDAYNEKAGFQSMFYIIIIVDEFSDIMMQDPAGVEKSIVRLASLARATGIHLILALQRPTTNVITGLIKANIPARIAFNVTSNVDSRVIIDQPGAEKLLGKGDMLFLGRDMSKPIRLQGAFVSNGEIQKLTDFLRKQGVSPEYQEDILTMGTNANNGKGNSSAGYTDVDELFDDSTDIVMSAGKASASLLQTKLSIGYARAARILQQLEEKGIVGPAQGSKPRDVLINGNSHNHQVNEEFNNVSSLR